MEAESVGPISVGMAKQYINCDTGVEAEDIVNVHDHCGVEAQECGASAARKLAAVAVGSGRPSKY